MPMLIVEDGTIVNGANTYASLADADAYCLARGLWVDSGADAVAISKKETALIRAADWLNGMDWKGAPVDALREMAWPRDGVHLGQRIEVDNNIVPPQVVTACIEAAAIFYGGESDPFAPQEHGGAIAAHSETVAVISESTTYREGAPAETAYKAVTARLRLFLASVDGESVGTRILNVGRA
ncbi:MAG: hypothetical protein PHN64_03815 [Desulfovibrionaceae bacterium]|nr:hypothetical protein [Desulfovibrionaceae bacterium]